MWPSQGGLCDLGNPSLAEALSEHPCLSLGTAEQLIEIKQFWGSGPQRHWDEGGPLGIGRTPKVGSWFGSLQVMAGMLQSQPPASAELLCFCHVFSSTIHSKSFLADPLLRSSLVPGPKANCPTIVVIIYPALMSLVLPVPV